MTDRRASRTCGKLTARTRGEPLRVSVCHCLACRELTRSVFAAQGRFPRVAVTLDGTSREFAQTGDEGTTARLHFCPDCGDTVYYLSGSIETSDLPPSILPDPCSRA
ncbi:GFA family protein [Lysobacter sp. A3-1-A15]|uniref:GFA family protein n=1 Tax=Novilysobacter viscosus TaxID=3098602 RepID=UPI002EDB793A